MVRVVLAPDRVMRIPHPAGLLRDLPWMELTAGDQLDVAPDEAAKLLARGIIVDPVTGRPKPAAPVAVPRVGVTFQAPPASPDDPSYQPVRIIQQES